MVLEVIKNMNNILVSIACITYNHEKYISDAIEGFLMQKTNFNFEILINDDASIDKTAEIIRKYEKQYPDIIKPIYQSENQFSKGVNIDYEFIQKRAKGKYIAECEGDDYWTDPYKLQKQVDYMESHSNCSICFHTAKSVTPNKKPTGDFLGPYGNKNRIYTISDIGGTFIATASRMYIKSLMDNPPDFYFIGEATDFPSQLILLDKGYAFYINEVMSDYRVNVPGSSNDRLKRKSKQEIIDYNNERIKILNEFNKYSNYRHKNDIKKFILSYKLNILELEKNTRNKMNGLKILESQKYFDSIKFIQKVKIHVKCYFPKFYVKLVHNKSLIKGFIYNMKGQLETNKCKNEIR